MPYVGFYQRPVFGRLFFGGNAAQGTIRQRHDHPMAERKLAVIDPAPQMKKLRLDEQSGGQLLLQGGTEIFTILRFGRIG